MASNKAKGILVDQLKHFGPTGTLQIFDIDFTLCNTMDTNTSAQQKAAFLEFYYRTAGGVIVATGRSSAGVDATLSGELPGSFEHHSAIRMTQGGDVIALAPEIDTNELGQYAKEYINGSIQIAENPDQVRQAEGHFGCVYPEKKRFALALVHSVGHADVETNRKVIEAAANFAIDKAGIRNTHMIARGSDAIEIVPVGLDKNSLISAFVDAKQIGHLKHALNKATAVHNFMSLPDFQNRIPNFLGDSGTDGKGMNAAAEFYNGTGTWVKNGKPVPEEFTKAVGHRTIENYFNTWEEIRAANQHLRDHSRIIILPKELVIATRTPS